MDYFISDFHFGYKPIIEFERFQFSTIQEHDEYIITCLEKTLHATDVLYFLGDLGYLEGELLARFQALPCYKKVMIKGNHDTRSAKYYRQEYGFTDVSDVPIFLNKRLVLSHQPIPVKNDTINVHGHLHGAKIAKNNYVNVSIAVANYQCLNHKIIDKMLSRLPKDNEKFLEEWYGDLHQATISRTDLLVANDDKIIGFKNLAWDRDRRIQVNKRKLIGYTVIRKNDDTMTPLKVQNVGEDGETIYVNYNLCYNINDLIFVRKEL